LSIPLQIKKNKNKNKKQKNQSSTLEKVHFYEARVYFRHIGFRQVEVLHFYRSAIKHKQSIGLRSKI